MLKCRTLNSKSTDDTCICTQTSIYTCIYINLYLTDEFSHRFPLHGVFGGFLQGPLSQTYCPSSHLPIQTSQSNFCMYLAVLHNYHGICSAAIRFPVNITVKRFTAIITYRRSCLIKCSHSNLESHSF